MPVPVHSQTQARTPTPCHFSYLCYPPYTRVPAQFININLPLVPFCFPTPLIHPSQKAFTQTNLPGNTALPLRHINAILIR